MSDFLERATQAAREAAPEHDRAAETRAKIMAAGRGRVIKRRRLATWLLPLAAAFVATGALAGGARWFGANVVVPAPQVTATATATPTAPRPVSTGRALPTTTAPEPIASAPESLPVVAPPSDPPAPSRVDAPLPRVAPSMPVGEAPVSPPVTAPPAVTAPPPVTAPPANAPADPPAPAPPPVKETIDPAEDLYRAAHEAHFRGGNPSAAIAAWDKYLAAAPNGRFAPEARFNRAMALLRAGRRAEGLSALEPFANGSFGGYRKQEAQRLLDAAKDAGAPLAP